MERFRFVFLALAVWGAIHPMYYFLGYMRETVVERFARSLALNCDSVHGTSGAPVFRDGRIVGVVSASDMGKGRGLSYAVLVDGALAALTDAPAAGAGPATPTARAATLFKKAPSGGARMPGGKRAPVK